MPYPLKESYSPGEMLNTVPADDLATIARVLNDIFGVGIDWLKTPSGRGWSVTLRVDDSTIELSSDKKLQIKADGITGAQIADDAVDTEHIANDAVEEAQLGGQAVTTSKIKVGNVGTDQIAGNAVTSAKTSGATGSYGETGGSTLNFTNGLLTSVT